MLYFENFCEIMASIGVHAQMMFDGEKWNVSLHQAAIAGEKYGDDEDYFETPFIKKSASNPQKSCNKAFKQWFYEILESCFKRDNFEAIEQSIENVVFGNYKDKKNIVKFFIKEGDLKITSDYQMTQSVKKFVALVAEEYPQFITKSNEYFKRYQNITHHQPNHIHLCIVYKNGKEPMILRYNDNKSWVDVHGKEFPIENEDLWSIIPER